MSERDGVFGGGSVNIDLETHGDIDMTHPKFKEQDKRSANYDVWKNRSSDRGDVTWTSFFISPLQKPSGDEGYVNGWTWLTAGLMNILMCLVYGWLYVAIVDYVKITNPSVGVQAFIVALYAAVMYRFIMISWSWNRRLPTQLSMSMPWATAFQLDDRQSMVSALWYYATSGGGYALGGWIASSNVSAAIMPEVLTTTELLMYWFGVFIIIGTTMMIQRFRHDDENESVKGVVSSKRIHESNRVGSMAIFVMTTVFYLSGNPYWGAGPYIAALAATGLGQAAGSSVLDWAFFMFVPITSALLWGLLSKALAALNNGPNYNGPIKQWRQKKAAASTSNRSKNN